MSLNAKAALSIVLLVLCMIVLIFGSAGTLNFGEGWLYLVVFVGASARRC
jgi:hypothetical protein